MSAQSPGGVSTNLTLWLRADAGVTGPTTASAWADQSTGGNNVSQATIGNRPTINAGNTANGINFNPVLTFDGTNDIMSTAAGVMTEAEAINTGATDAGSQYIVLRKRSTDNPVYTYSTGSSAGTWDIGFNTNGNFYVASKTSDNGTPATLVPSLNSYNGTSSAGNARLDGTPGAAITGTRAVTGNQRFWIGGRGTTLFSNCDIAEVIVYNANQSANVDRIETYLAVKYGIHKTGNYVNSSSTVIWDATTNSTWHNDVAGIGRDDMGGSANAGLVQKQTANTNGSDIVTMGLGTIATTNAGNSNTFSANQSYLIWGRTTGALTWTSTETNSPLRQRLVREWKVQESGTVGSVLLRVPDNSSTLTNKLPAETVSVQLLVDGDGDFSSGATEYQMTLNGTNWEVSVDLTDGQYFTIATGTPYAPGGVTGAAIWLKADFGVTTGGTMIWADQSGNNRNGVQSTAGNQPVLTSNSINFNPALTFDGSNDYLTLQNLTGLPTGASAVEAFSVARHTNVSSNWAHIIAYGGLGANQFFTLGKHQGTANAITAFNSTDAISTALEFANNNPVLSNGKYTGTQGVISTFGTQRNTIAFTGNKLTTAGYVGVDPALALSTCWTGTIPEIVLYPSNLSTINVQKVNSYFALKYGITLDQTTATNYLAADGTTIWNASLNPLFKNNIAGIGRDEASALNQKQSRSVNTSSSGNLVTMGLGSIATDNASNTNAFSADDSFLIWADNNGDVASWTDTETSGSNRWRIAREWLVQETGTVGTVTIRVPDNAASGSKLPAENTTIYLLVDADGNFASGATEYAMTLNGTNWETTVNFTSGQYFTFATVAGTAPGGVVANLSLWLKANAGTNTTTDGSNVTSWADQSGNGNNATTTANTGSNWISPGSNPPVYKSGSSTNGLNFNPTVNFSGSKSLDGAGGLSTHNVFAVFNNATGSGISIIGYDDPAGAGGGGQSSLWFDPSFFYHAIRNTSTDNYIQFFGNAALGSPSATAILDLQHISSSSGSIFVNGVDATGGTSSNNVTPSPFSGKYRLGKASTNDFASSPVFAEVISYGRSLSAAERQRVTSYLAAKYGMTLTINYCGSDWNGSTGTIFWHQTTNAGYNNNITVIGRDDSQGFNQKQSRSINTASNGNMVTIGLGSIATENSANANTFPADDSFLAFGDNNGSTAKTTINTPVGTCARMIRIWKVQETGTEVGNVEVRLNLSALSATYGSYSTSALKLAVATNATFSSGVRTYSATSYVSGIATFSGVDLDNGEFFTLGLIEGNFTPSISSNSPVCEGGELDLQASGGTAYAWSGPFGFTSSQQNPTIPFTSFSNAGTFSVTISTSFGCSSVQTVSVSVNSCNPLVCSQTLCNNTTATGSITGTDADGDALTYTTIQSPANGTLTIVGNNYTYDPVNTFYGEDQFTIRTCDPSGACVECVKKFVVTTCGSVPVCGTNTTISACAGIAASGTLNATDPSGGSLTYAIVSQPANGSVSLVGANYTFTPTTGFEGETTWIYSATNANGSVQCTITAYVENCFSTCDGGGCGSTNLITGGTYYTAGSNVFCQNSISVSTNTEYCFKANLTDNCSTCDSTATVYFTINGIQIGLVTNADLPTATATAQGFSFNTGDIGNPSTISVCITHVNFGTPATHIIAASPELKSVGNILPQASDDSGISICKNSGAYSVDVLDNDVNVISTTTLTITSSMPGATGTAVVSSGNIIFTPNSTFSGTASITYQICNGTCCDAGAVSIEVVEPTISLPLTPICSTSAVTLTATVGGISSELANFQWQSSSNNSTWTNISNATATNYAVGVLGSTTYFRIVMTPSSANCSAMASVAQVVATNFPTASASSNSPLCVGGTAQFTGSATGGQSPYTWAWTGAASFSSTAQNPTRASVTLAMGGNYTLTVTDAFGCTGTQTTVLVVNSDPGATVNVPTNTVCVGGNVTLTATGSGGAGTCGYQWQSSPNGTTWTDISGATSSTFTTPNLSSQTRYRVIYTCSGEGCCN